MLDATAWDGSVNNYVGAMVWLVRVARYAALEEMLDTEGPQNVNPDSLRDQHDEHLPLLPPGEGGPGRPRHRDRTSHGLTRTPRRPVPGMQLPGKEMVRDVLDIAVCSP
ncbi:hypothetical protein [Streptomyces sp. CA-179760]|uniref:hypothetical protein n=1 Tax=Streptomyces sp. CA-179760 TaxID=3240054 RepID=UPI003D9414CE